MKPRPSTFTGIGKVTLQTMAARRMAPIAAIATHPIGEVTRIIMSSCSGDDSFSTEALRSRFSGPCIALSWLSGLE